jgi:nucleotide-binding universal stress UspA family protein
MAAHARNILVGYDGSDAAKRALDAAADLSGYGSSLSVVSVARETGALDRTLAFDGRLSARRLLSEARSRLLHRHVTARYLEPVGEPAEMLIETACELDADLIVVGRRDQNPLRRLVLGSVSAKVLHRAECDVLVVR